MIDTGASLTAPQVGGDYYAATVDDHPNGGGAAATSGRARPTGPPAMFAVIMLGALGMLVALRAGFRGFVITV
jgi:hypothetical protein